MKHTAVNQIIARGTAWRCVNRTGHELKVFKLCGCQTFKKTLPVAPH